MTPRNKLKHIVQLAVLATAAAAPPATAAQLTMRIEQTTVPLGVVPGQTIQGSFVAYDFFTTSDQDIRGISLRVTPSAGLEIFNIDRTLLGGTIFVGNVEPFPSEPPETQFDTFVNIPVPPETRLQDIDLLGRASGGPAMTPPAFGPDFFSVSWGDRIISGPQTDFRFARVTLGPIDRTTSGLAGLINAPGTFDLTLVVEDTAPPLFQADFTFSGVLPEPGTLALLTGGVLLAPRRRTA